MVRSELDLDVGEAVVAAGAALAAQPNGSARKGDVVDDHEQIAGGIELVEAQRLGHRGAREIHVGHRLEKEDLLAGRLALDGERLKARARRGRTVADRLAELARQAIDAVETHIVAGSLIFESWVAESDDDLHGVLVFLMLVPNLRPICGLIAA